MDIFSKADQNEPLEYVHAWGHFPPHLTGSGFHTNTGCQTQTLQTRLLQNATVETCQPAVIMLHVSNTEQFEKTEWNMAQIKWGRTWVKQFVRQKRKTELSCLHLAIHQRFQKSCFTILDLLSHMTTVALKDGIHVCERHGRSSLGKMCDTIHSN